MKWVVRNKGDKEKPEYRCRLLAKESQKDEREDLIAKKVMFSSFASMPGLCLDFVDAVSLPPCESQEESTCGLPEEDHQDGMRAMGNWSTVR